MVTPLGLQFAFSTFALSPGLLEPPKESLKVFKLGLCLLEGVPQGGKLGGMAWQGTFDDR